MTPAAAARLGGLVLLLSCAPADNGGGAQVETRGNVARVVAAPDSLGIGRSPEPNEIAAWDLDVNPDGVGLPSGGATAESGAAAYAAKCAICHGAKGEGVAPNPALVGREPREGFPFAQSLTHVRTVGNYWPYATTLFDYVRRAMPQMQPGSLTTDELYGVTAWILAENGIIARNHVVDALSLPRVKLPALGRFVRDDRLKTSRFR